MSIFWRDDSQDFCVRYLENEHKLRVYNISGQIVIKTLLVPDMIPCVTWRRGMIVCARKDENGTFFLSMYERNGLFNAVFELDSEVKTTIIFISLIFTLLLIIKFIIFFLGD